MSISLLISGENLPEEKWENIPVASEAAFNEFWKPLIEDFDYIPLFELGLDIDDENLEDVRKELQLIESKMSKLSEHNINYVKPLERVHKLQQVLSKAETNHSKMFIG